MVKHYFVNCRRPRSPTYLGSGKEEH